MRRLSSRHSLVILAALAALVLVGPAATAHAQESPPPGPPASGPPGAGPPAGGGSTDQLGALHAAGVAVANEAAVLLDLGAFGTSADRISAAIGPVRLPDGSASVDDLDARDTEAASALSALQGTGAPIPPEAQTVLARLSSADRDAAGTGRSISIQSEVYVLALDELLVENGGPPNGGPPDTAAIAAALGSAGGASSGEGAPAEASSGGGTSGSGGSWLWLAVVAVALLAVAALVWRRRSARSERAPQVIGLPALRPYVAPPPADAVADRIDELLEVSRRLTSATASGDIERAVVREAMGLVRANAASLVRRVDDELVVGHQSHPDLLLVDRLGDGIIGRVSETGQPVMQVSATEPAVRFLPVSLAAVPLVGGGRVDGVLMLVRDASDPFTSADRERLMALAPLAAAALLSARRAAAAIEDSLVDPLTGAGNRRRFDAELEAILTVASGRPTSVVMVDLDKFKSVNDTHGHPAGDALLQGAAGVLRGTVRPRDGVYRYGGEEFVVVLPDTPVDMAVEVAERIRTTIAGTMFQVGNGVELRVTASFGVAAATDGGGSDLVARADSALYRAKESGRDRVVADGAGELSRTPE